MTDLAFIIFFAVSTAGWSGLKLAEAIYETNRKRRAVALFWALAAGLSSLELLGRLR